jgi:hypothetical protein
VKETMQVRIATAPRRLRRQATRRPNRPPAPNRALPETEWIINPASRCA